jgi:hypothetical protein
MELEIINKLYLELSQVTTAKTRNDIELDRVSEDKRRRGELLEAIFNCDEVEALPSEIKSRIAAELISPGRPTNNGGLKL